MISKADFKQFVSRVWGNKIFLILLLFNLLSNGVAVVPYPDALSVFMIICISALSATIESCICRLFRSEKTRNCALGFFVALHMIAAIIVLHFTPPKVQRFFGAAKFFLLNVRFCGVV